MASPIVMPSFGMYTADGTLVSWLQPSGTSVRQGEPVLEIETDKATQEVVAPAEGVLHHVAKIGARLQEQMIIGYILTEGEAPPVTTPPVQSPSGRPGRASIPVAAPADFIKATPIARRLAEEHGVPLRSLAGSGPGGRIVEADVLAATDHSRPMAPPRTELAYSVNCRERERIPFSGMRRSIADRLKQSQTAAVSLTLTREASATALAAAREQSRTCGSKISADAFFVKFLSAGLRELPELNVVVSGDDLVLLDEVNIGFAVSVPGGLTVPVIREADTLSVVHVEERIRTLAESARNGTLQMSDIQDGTSTVSNLGGFGIDAFTPVLNPPQSTVLGIGRIAPRPVAVDGQVKVEPTVWLSLTFDHRVADGAAAAKLLDSIVRQMMDQSLLEQMVKQS